MKLQLSILLLLTTSICALAQVVPSRFENISHLMTFGPEADGKWGDDDHVQVYFFSVPATHKEKIYLRVYDPSTQGQLDQSNGGFNTKTRFAIYGGKGAYSNKVARGIDPVKGYDSGIELDAKIFGKESQYDQKWYSFGPFNPKEGEFVKGEKNSGDRYMFKVIAKGVSGNDGNGYKLSLSSSTTKNGAVPGAKAFAFEICFRLNQDKQEVAHFYPFVGEGVTNIKQNNFDFDNNGNVLITSVVKNMHPALQSGDGNWNSSIHRIEEEEHNLVLDVQIVQKKSLENDMAIYILNQYGEALPFFSIPADGLRKYKYKVKVKID